MYLQIRTYYDKRKGVILEHGKLIFTEFCSGKTDDVKLGPLKIVNLIPTRLEELKNRISNPKKTLELSILVILQLTGFLLT